MRAVVLVLVLALAAGTAAAKSRLPETKTVAFDDGDQTILIGTTVGMLISHDDGATWRWTCEQNIGYFGIWDPVYALSPAGTIFAGLPDGLSISRDGGCTFTRAPGIPLAKDIQVAADGAIWVVTSGGGVTNGAFVSRDDGVTFQATALSSTTDFYRRVRVAPSDPSRVYVTGYRLGTAITPLLFRSGDGGTTFVELPFAFGAETQDPALGVSPTDPDVLFVRVDGLDDWVLRSEDAGATFTSVLQLAGENVDAFAARADGSLYWLGSKEDPIGIRISTDHGLTWEAAPQQLAMTCVGERPADGDVFACADNWEPDWMALARSTDGVTWTKVFRFRELSCSAELECPPGSGHHEEYCPAVWAEMLDDLGLDDLGLECEEPDAGVIPTPDGGAGVDDGPADCGCRAGSRGAPAEWLILLAAGSLLLRRRRA
jgi:hypothetical protein